MEDVTNNGAAVVADGVATEDTTTMVKPVVTDKESTEETTEAADVATEEVATEAEVAA